MIDKINRSGTSTSSPSRTPSSIVHPHKKCVVNQREMNSDTYCFKAALKYVLRQDPDKVLIGEMRDLETIEAALIIAETGHLTFATLHTNSAVQTINRIIDVFPPISSLRFGPSSPSCWRGCSVRRSSPRPMARGEFWPLRS